MLGDTLALGLRAEGDSVEHCPVLLHDDSFDHAGHVPLLILVLPVSVHSFPLSPASTREPEQVEDGAGKVVHDHFCVYNCLNFN